MTKVSKKSQTKQSCKTGVNSSFSSEEDYDMYLMDLAYAPLIEYEAKRQIKHENMFKVIKKYSLIEKISLSYPVIHFILS